MLILDRLLIGGIKFVLNKVVAAVDQELNDDTVLREQLLTAQMQLELGEMSQEEFDQLEEGVLIRLREIQERKGGGPISPLEFKITGAEAQVTFELDDDEDQR